MRRLLLLTILIATTALGVSAQQPTSFTYQGKLNVNTLPANGVYDFAFNLSDVPVGAGAVDSTVFIGAVQVTNGVFTVNLNFPPSVWTTNPGPRFLTIAVKAAADSTYFVLDPRQPVGSAPFATNALNAISALTASTALNADHALTATNASTAAVASDSAALGGLSAANFLQLNPSATQSGRFAVQNGFLSGDLTATRVNATSQFDLDTRRVMFADNSSNFFVGLNTGTSTSLGLYNVGVGFENLRRLTIGSYNVSLGAFAGPEVTSGTGNTFVGYGSGTSATEGGSNTFVGRLAGASNATGNENVFVGDTAGFANLVGSRNTLVGQLAALPVGSILNNASAIGNRALVAADNSLVLGSIFGVNGATADTNVGIGTPVPLSRLDVRGNLFVGLSAQPNVPGNLLTDARAIYLSNDVGDANNSFRIDGAADNLYFVARSGGGAASGAGLVFSTAPTGQGEFERMSIAPTGQVRVNVLGANGATPVCRNASNELATCAGPIAGETKKNDEQDALILQQKEQIERQQKEIDALKALVCATNTTAAVCRAKE